MRFHSRSVEVDGDKRIFQLAPFREMQLQLSLLFISVASNFKLVYLILYYLRAFSKQHSQRCLFTMLNKLYFSCPKVYQWQGKRSAKQAETESRRNLSGNLINRQLGFGAILQMFGLDLQSNPHAECKYLLLFFCLHFLFYFLFNATHCLPVFTSIDESLLQPLDSHTQHVDEVIMVFVHHKAAV